MEASDLHTSILHETEELSYDIVVIGGGPAGMAAAIEGAKYGAAKVLVIERDRELGGILQQCIHNGFGLQIFGEELTGPEYAERFIDQLKEMHIQYKLNTMVLNISEDKQVTYVNDKEGLVTLQAKAVILAMGCRERTRGALAIPGFRPAGIFTAGTAQRFVNMEGYMVGKKVVILGSGDIGLIMARRMTLEGAQVKVVAEVMPYSGGLIRNIVQCLNDYHIPLLLNHTVTDIRGKDRVEGVVISQVDENRKPISGTEQYYECDTLLLSVGLIPENELSRSVGIQLDPITGGPMVSEVMETTIKGIFACGNAVHVHDLVDYVTEESRRAGKGAAQYIKNAFFTFEKGFDTKPGKGIRYIVPHYFQNHAATEDILDLFMRVDNIYEHAALVVKWNGKTIKRIARRYMAPGEMEHIKLDLKLISLEDNGLLTVAVEGKEDKNESI